MAFKIQYKAENGRMTDVPIAATTDINGNNIHEHYATKEYVDNAVEGSGGSGGGSEGGVASAIRGELQISATTQTYSLRNTGSVCTFIHGAKSGGDFFSAFVPDKIDDKKALVSWLVGKEHGTTSTKYTNVSGFYNNKKIVGMYGRQMMSLTYVYLVMEDDSTTAINDTTYTVSYDQEVFYNPTITAVNRKQGGIPEPLALHLTDFTLYIDEELTEGAEVVNYLSANMYSTKAVTGYVNNGLDGDLLVTNFQTMSNGYFVLTTPNYTFDPNSVSELRYSTLTSISLSGSGEEGGGNEGGGGEGGGGEEGGDDEGNEPITATYYAGANEANDALEINAYNIEFITNKNSITLDEIVENKQDKLTAGSNIVIVDNVISAVSTGGDTSELEAEVQQLKTNTEQSISSLQTQLGSKQNQLTAGENITIVNNVISATVSGGGGGSTNVLDNLIVDIVQFNGFSCVFVGVKSYDFIGATVRLVVEGVFSPDGGFSPDAEDGKFEVDVSFGGGYMTYGYNGIYLGIANIRRFADASFNEIGSGFPNYGAGSYSSVSLPASWMCPYYEYELSEGLLTQFYDGVIIYDGTYGRVLEASNVTIISANITI